MAANFAKVPERWADDRSYTRGPALAAGGFRAKGAQSVLSGKGCACVRRAAPTFRRRWMAVVSGSPPKRVTPVPKLMQTFLGVTPTASAYRATSLKFC